MKKIQVKESGKVKQSLMKIELNRLAFYMQFCVQVEDALKVLVILWKCVTWGAFSKSFNKSDFCDIDGQSIVRQLNAFAECLNSLNKEEFKNGNTCIKLERQGYLLVFNLGISLLCLHPLSKLMYYNLC